MDTVDERPLKNESVKVKKKTFLEKLKYIKENVTVEPVLCTYVIPGALTRLATQNLNLDKACRVNKNFGDKICDALVAREGNKYMTEEKEVQRLVVSMEIWKNVLLTAIPSLLIIFIGAWSDRTGKRKICFLFPIIGELLMCISNILNTYYFYELPVEVTMFFEALFPAITGGWITTHMGAFSYISDISSEESRTFRLGIANLCLTAGTPIGLAMAGILLKHIGYYGVFGLSSVLYIFSLTYGFIYIKDVEKPKREDDQSSVGFWEFLKNFFHIRHVKDTLIVALKKGPNQRREKCLLVLFTVAFVYGPSYGEATIRYLYTRYRFNWDLFKYSMYGVFFIYIHSLGAIISISIFSRRLKWHDSVLGLISNISKMIGSTCVGLARNTSEMYFAVTIEMFNATSFTALRSISSKLVSSDELGKMTSLFNLTEILASMLFAPLYSWVYRLTLKIDGGIAFYISAALHIPAVIVFGYKPFTVCCDVSIFNTISLALLLNGFGMIIPKNIPWFYIGHRRSLNRTRKEVIMKNLETS